MKTPAAYFDSFTLDIGRVLAASAIFYFHAGRMLGILPLARLGEFAVEYFVILAGVTYLLFSTSRPASLSDYASYFKKRLAALFPLFLLVNVILYGASYGYPSGLGRPYSLAEFLASATGVSIYLDWKYLSSVMWFMPFILQVYLLLPLIDWCARRVHPVLLMLAAFAVSAFLAQMVPGFVSKTWIWGIVCKNWSPIFRLPEVCAGLILARSVLTPGQGLPGIMALLVFGGLSFAVSSLKSAGVDLLVYLPWGGFLVPLIIFLVSAWIAPGLRGVKPDRLRLLGLASFPFFLFHAAPLLAISRRFGSQPFIWALYFLACWLFSVGLTLFYARVRNWAGDLARRAEH